MAFFTEPSLLSRKKALTDTWIVGSRERPPTDAAMSMICGAPIPRRYPLKGAAPRDILGDVRHLPFMLVDDYNARHRPNG
jgi:hypothetical protein